MRVVREGGGEGGGGVGGWGGGGGGGRYVSICMQDTVLSDAFHFSTNEEIYNRTLLVMLFILFPENDNPRFFPSPLI